MDITLWEGDGDASGIESFVNHFLCTVHETDALSNQHILLHIDIHRTVAHVADYHIDTVFWFHDFTAITVLGTHFLHALNQHLSHQIDISSVCYTDSDGGELIRVIAGKVVEVFTKACTHW